MALAKFPSVLCEQDCCPCAVLQAYFNGVHSPGLLSLRTLVGKLVSALFVLSAGLIAEGEAPFVHIGAVVGGGFASAGSR